MAFKLNNFDLTGTSPNTNSPNVFKYGAGNDTLATVLSSNYFQQLVLGQNNRIKKSDLIYVSASDDEQLIKVTQITPTIETQQFSEVIDNGSVTTDKLANQAVTEPKLADNAVSTVKIQNDAVTTAKIPTGAITPNELGTDSVTNPKIATGAVNTDELANNAVTNPKIATNAVNSNELATDAVTNPKIATGAVDTDELATDAVTTDKIAENAVTSVELGTNSVNTVQITDDNVTQVKLKQGDIDTDISVRENNSTRPFFVGGYRRTTLAGGGNTVSITVPFAMRVLSFSVRMNGNGNTGNTIQLFRNTVNPITEQIDVSGKLEDDYFFSNKVDQIQDELLSGNTLDITTTETGGDLPLMQVFIQISPR